jgi:hypothetical protein
MTIIDHRAKPRGRATPFDLSAIGAPAMPSNFEAFEVRSAPESWAGSARHHDLRQGDRILVDWSRRPDMDIIGAVRVDGGARFAVFDGDQSAAIFGRLVNPSMLLRI